MTLSEHIANKNKIKKLCFLSLFAWNLPKFEWLPILTGGVGESSTIIGGEEDLPVTSTPEVAAVLNGLKISGAGVSVAMLDELAVGTGGGGVGFEGMALLTASLIIKHWSNFL